MTRWNAVRAAGTLALLALGAGAAVAHGGHGPGAQGSGYGHMMGQGYGYHHGMMGPGMMGPGMMEPGMMGPGGGYGQGMGPGSGMMGPGMMGRGMMGPGMSGQGYGPGYGDPGLRVVPPQHTLSTDEVRQRLQRWLAQHGLSGLQVASVEAEDEDTIVAELATGDGTMVQRYRVDRRTGFMQPAQ